MAKITVCSRSGIICYDNSERCAECIDYYPADEYEALQTEIARLRKALEFYQDIENYKSTAPVARGDGTYDYDVPVLIDTGDIARRALETSDESYTD